MSDLIQSVERGSAEVPPDLRSWGYSWDTDFRPAASFPSAGRPGETPEVGMLPWQVLATNALVYGAVLSLVLGAIMTVSVALSPDVWVGDYPPDIRAKHGEMSPRAARLRPFIAAPFFVALAAIPLLALSSLADRVGAVPFLPAFASTFLVLLVFNSFDLLIADWLVFCTIQPRQVVLPGTEGMSGYRDYRFHFVGFLKGLAFCFAAALLIAGGWTAGRAILG